MVIIVGISPDKISGIDRGLAFIALEKLSISISVNVDDGFYLVFLYLEYRLRL